jgi:hypothetical protein
MTKLLGEGIAAVITAGFVVFVIAIFVIAVRSAFGKRR